MGRWLTLGTSSSDTLSCAQTDTWPFREVSLHAGMGSGCPATPEKGGTQNEESMFLKYVALGNYLDPQE